MSAKRLFARNMFSRSSADLTRERGQRVMQTLVMQWAVSGLIVGLAIMLGGWYVEIAASRPPHDENAFFKISEVRLLHERSRLIYLVDMAPIALALIFARLGFVQGKLRAANMMLEDRVLERTVENTLERARTSAILDSAADSIVAFTASGEITLYNNAAERLFGYRRSETVGRHVGIILPALAEAPAGIGYKELIRSLQKQTQPGAPRSLTGLRNDGTAIPVEADVSEFTLGDEVSYTVIIRDVTERRRQERLQKSLLDVTQAVNRTQDLMALYESIHDSLSQVIDVTNFYIALLEPDGRSYRVVFCVDDEIDAPDEPMPLGGTLVDYVIRAGQPVLLSQKEIEALVQQGDLKPSTRLSVSWLGVPLVSRGEPIGMMAAHSHAEGIVYTQKDVWILDFVSGQIANAIEREHARESLRQSERRYRRMIEEAGDIVYTTDLQGYFTYANPPIMKLTGYMEEELIGQHSSILLDDEWRGQVRAFYTRQLRDKVRETVFEFPIKTKTGHRRWIEQSTTMLIENDRPAGFQSIVHDITERREAEAALREREERFRSLSASSPIGIFQVNARGMCVYTNKRWQEITGRSLEASLGSGWLDAIHPDDRQTFKIEWLLSREEASTSSREVRVQREDGSVRWVNIRWTSTYDEMQQPTGYVGTFEDITPRKTTEQVNRVLYEISQAAQTTDDLRQFFASIHQSLSSVIDTTNFYVALYNPEEETISFPYAREGDEELQLPARPVGKGLTGHVIRTGRHLLLDEEGLERIYLSGEIVPVGKPAKNWLGVPLLTKDGVIGAVVLQSYTSAHFYTERDVQTITFVSSQMASAIQRKQAEEERRRTTQELAEAHARIKEDLRLAARIQQARLPKSQPDTDVAEFSWLFDSCDEVAGDMFNYVQLSDHQIGVYILDVSGHGVPAALLSMSLSRSMTAAPDGSGALMRAENGQMVIASPAEVAEVLNERFPMNLDVNQYFTVLYGILDLRDLTFTFVRAGHPAPVLVDAKGAHLIDENCGPAIGIIPGMKYEQTTLRLSPGEEVFFYTDGVDEATDVSGEEFGVERILDALSTPQGNIEADVQRLREMVRRFSNGKGQSDDITIVGFRIRQPSEKTELPYT